MDRSIVAVLGVLFAAGCASGPPSGVATVPDGDQPTVEIRVLNALTEAAVVYAFWDRGVRTNLGMVGAGARRTFTVPRAGEKLAVRCIVSRAPSPQRPSAPVENWRDIEVVLASTLRCGGGGGE